MKFSTRSSRLTIVSMQCKNHQIKLTGTVFDNGILRDDPIEAGKLVDKILCIMSGTNHLAKPGTPLVEIFASIWARVQNVSITETVAIL